MINFKNYKCAFCGKEGVKLWHVDNGILICAHCAETRQAPRTQKEYTWTKSPESKCYSGKTTGKTINLPAWRVDKDGYIPSSYSYPHSKRVETALLPIEYNGAVVVAAPAYADNTQNAKERWMEMPNT